MRVVRVCVSLVVVAASLAALPLALAAGGHTIASAPLVTARQLHVGNTGQVPELGTCFLGNSSYSEFWRVRLIAGDSLTVNFGITQTNVDFVVSLYRHGTTDSSLDGARPLATAVVGRDGKGRITFSAARSGTHPLRFASCSGFDTGPFEFRALVKHRAGLALPPARSIDRMGTVAVQVRTPDGRPITDPGLRVTLRGTWGNRTRTLGRTTPTRGVASFRLSLPASVGGSAIQLSAVASGRDYFGAATAARTVRVR
jgi:hypothetical protein